MFEEGLLVKPKADEGSVTKMERTLNSRFAKLAKNFSGGLKDALIGSGTIGAIIAIIDQVVRLLNPVADTVETLKGLLDRGDDIVNQAKQFNTTEGKLFTLQSIAGSVGVDHATVSTLLSKFQGSLSEAQLHKDTPGAQLLKGFAGEKDTATAFVDFVKSLQGASKEVQTFTLNTLFGEKLVGKSDQLLNTDLEAQRRKLRIAPEEQLTANIKRVGGLAGIAQLKDEQRRVDDFSINSGNLKRSTVDAAAAQADKEAADQRKRFAGADARLAVAKNIDIITGSVQRLTDLFYEHVPTTAKGTKEMVIGISKLLDSRPIRTGIGGLIGNKQ